MALPWTWGLGFRLNIGVIDIGTNSVHMLVVRIDAELKAHVLDRAKEMVRLGQGVFETGRLDETAQARALHALTTFARLAERRGVERVIAVATSAVREADNGGTFLQEVYAATGIHPRIITGAEEARLVFKAVQTEMPLDESPVLVVDLGGGSAEIACGNSRSFSWAASLPLGVQRLEKLALRDGEPDRAGRAALRTSLEQALAPVAARAGASGVKRVYVTSGSAGATLKLLRERGDVASDAAALPRKALGQLDDELAEMARDKRRALGGLEAARQDLIVGAVSFFRQLADALDAPELVVMDRGLREGMVQDFIDTHGPELQWEVTEPNARRREVLRFGERFHYDAHHAHHVSRLAVQLFDGTRALHGMDEAARELLTYGALLHDVGYALNEKAHHKHGEYLILNGLRGGFTEEETRIIAAIARYHRKAAPKDRHENWAALRSESRELVRRAEAILRVADALDRSHARVVQNVWPTIEDDRVVLDLEADGPIELELWVAKRKSDWFEEVFDHGIAFRIAGAHRVSGGEPLASP